MSRHLLGSHKMKKPHIYKKWGGGWGYCVSDSYERNLAVCQWIAKMNQNDPDWKIV
jgi:hypothetical protein